MNPTKKKTEVVEVLPVRASHTRSGNGGSFFFRAATLLKKRVEILKEKKRNSLSISFSSFGISFRKRKREGREKSPTERESLYQFTLCKHSFKKKSENGKRLIFRIKKGERDESWIHNVEVVVQS